MYHNDVKMRLFQTYKEFEDCQPKALVMVGVNVRNDSENMMENSMPMSFCVRKKSYCSRTLDIVQKEC